MHCLIQGPHSVPIGGREIHEVLGGGAQHVGRMTAELVTFGFLIESKRKRKRLYRVCQETEYKDVKPYMTPHQRKEQLE